MANPDREEAANLAGWVVAAIVAVVAICAITFMVTMRPATTPVVAASGPLRGPENTIGLNADMARMRAARVDHMAQQTAAKAKAVADAADRQAARAPSPMTAGDAAADASTIVPVAPSAPAPTQSPAQ